MFEKQNIIDTRKIYPQRSAAPSGLTNKNNSILEKNPKLIDNNPYDFLIPEHSQDVFFHWRAPEHDFFEKDRNWFFWIGFVLLIIIAWALYINSPLMAITFILIGVVGYIHVKTEPKVLDFMILKSGIASGKNIYEFNNIKSFWIFYEHQGLRVISLQMKSGIIPFVHIPIHDQNPARLREVLLEYLPEEKHELGIVETAGMILGI